MLKLLLALLIGWLLIATVDPPIQEPDQANKLLDRQTTSLPESTVIQAVINALSYADTSGGVAQITDCNQATHKFRPTDSSLRAALNSIVSADPRFTWEIKDNVINVLPKNGPPPFLAVRISRVEINQADSIDHALLQLLEIPEVKQASLSLGLRFVQGRAYPFCPQGCPPEQKKKISVKLMDATVLEALNAMARAHGSAVWWFQQHDCGGRKSFVMEIGAKQ